jgi:uracil DNA glycosylase
MRWADALAAEQEKPYYARLRQLVTADREKGEVYPAPEQVFRALDRRCAPSTTSWSPTSAVDYGK